MSDGIIFEVIAGRDATTGLEAIQPPSFGTMLKYGSASFMTRATEGRTVKRSK
jgi:hypothetical protein